MSNRSASENSDSISLFPFLAVLLCTMGALLVLLVILVQRAAEHALLPDANPLELIAAAGPATDNSAKQALLQQELAEFADYQKQLDGLRAEGAKRLEKERLRLSHSEEHARRLQEELVKLTIAAEQLKQTEGNQSVDQEQAEQEATRLEQLVIDTIHQLEKLREDAPSGKRSYAIVPYKGPNGTYRKPIYLECSSKGVKLQPEGLLLTADDFIAPNWPGNPLAAALRASREYLNDKAAQAGEPEPPDPYPLIIIRPSGIQQYALARAAITSWDSDYGYEFVEEDMKLTFPEAPDPQLARVQHHAVMNSRDRLLHLVQSAPSRFRGMRAGGGRGNGTGAGSSGSGNGEYGSAGTNLAGGSGPESTETDNGGGNGYASGGQPGGEQLAGEASGQSGDPQIGALAGGGSGSGAGSGDVTHFAESSGEAGSQSASGSEPNLVGPRYAQQGSSGGAGGQGTPTNTPSEPLKGKDQANGGGGGSQQMAGSSGGGGSSGAISGGSPRASFSNSSGPSIADARGSNWAVNEPRQKSVAIRRPIHVVVRQNKMILTPTGNARRGLEATGQEISLDQSVHDISDNFATAVRDRIEEWGLAGTGMYWRPVLELSVEANATMTAARIVHLLKDSGVEVQLPETARAGAANEGETVR